MNFQTAQWINLALLGALAITLAALVLGVSVPRWALAGLVVAQALFRAWRDLRWGGVARRGRIGANLLLTLVLAGLILSVR